MEQEKIPAAGPQSAQSKKAGLWRLLPLAILIAAMAAAWWFGLTGYLSFQAIADNRARLAEFVADYYLLSLLAFALAYAAAVALSLPGGAFLTILGGFLFGAVAGSLVTVISATAGATILFVIARSSLGEALARRAGATLARLRAGFQKDAFSYLLFLRLVPAFPFWLVNLAPALLGVPLRVYVPATLIGIIPGTFAFSYAGSALDSIITRQRRAHEACLAEQGVDCTLELSFADILTPEILAAFVILGLVALIPVGVRRLRAGRSGG